MSEKEVLCINVEHFFFYSPNGYLYINKVLKMIKISLFHLI